MALAPETERLFHAVADLTTTARHRYFNEHAVPAEIRTELETLLHHDASTHRDLSRIVEASAAQFLQTPVNTRCGPYRLLHPIGSGGMGTVYLAERDDGEVRQTVAIKFLRYGGDEPAFRDRFLRERQILATLAHSGIARLLDAGHAADGQPYLVMEYIDGAPIDAFAEPLDLRKKLQLFLQVCDAVSYAHQNLIVHRDIKPSNILVDSDGHPRLLDFGVAKLLEQEDSAAAETLLTRQFGGMLTPEYAAPEQVSGGPATTAIDVYALGVLLYVLLTGRHPLASASRSCADLLKAITDTVPPRPSAMATASLHRQLRGDLDTIVAKALKKNPRERYPSVAAFADDLRRYLAHQPIAARPDTLAYRAARFVRRNRAPVALGAVALVALVGGIVSTLVEARTARAQRDFALRQLSRAEAVNDLNSFVLSDAAPSGKPFTVADLLARAERIVERQSAAPSERIDLLIEIGRQYTVTDQYARARQLLEQAYALSRALPDASIRAGASCALAQTLSRLGEPARAEQLFQEGLATLPDRPTYALDRIFCLERGSEIARNRGVPDQAIARALAARALLKQVPISSGLADLNTLVTLAGGYRIAGRYPEAAAAFQQAAALLAAFGRDDTQRAGTVFNNWGITLLESGQMVEAEKVLRRVLQIGSADAADAGVPSMSLVNYARALYGLARLDEAADYAARAWSVAQQDGDEPALDQSLLLRAAIYRDRRDLVRSAQMLAQVEPRLRRTLPPGHLAFAVLDSERALNAQAAGDVASALTLSNQAVAIAEALAAKNRQGADRLPVFLARRAMVELDLGHSADASSDAARAVALLQKTAASGTHSSILGRAYFALGRALEAQHQSGEARSAFRSAAEHFTATLGPTHPDTLAARRTLEP